jgi:HK97 family phage portal protein
MRMRERFRLFRAAGAWPDITLEEFAQQMDAALDGGQTRSGVPMGPTNAMAISAFFCGVNLIMGAIASMPCLLYRRTDKQSRERYQEHPLYGVLHDQVNPYMTSHQWKRAMTGRVVLWGNAYSIMTRDPREGVTTGVEQILDTPQVRVMKEKKTRRLIYEITHGPGNKELLARDTSPRFIFHIPGPGFNGLTGYSIINLARESLGLTAAMEQFGQQYFGKGVHASGFLERPLEAPKLQTEEARKRLVQSIIEQYAGMANQGKLVLLEEGTKFNRNTIPLEDAQFLLSRTFQIEEVARWLNLSPARLKDLSRATFSNIEQLQIMDLQDCFMPWASLIESEIHMQLIEERNRKNVFPEFLMDALLRADSVAQANALAIERQWGITSADEWRAIKNRNPQPDGIGQKYILPSNYTIAAKLGETDFPATAPSGPVPEQPPGDSPQAEK